MFRSGVKPLCVWLVGICMAGSLSAQQVQQSDTITGKVHDIEEVQVLSRRTPKRVSATMPVQVMSKSQLNDLGIQSMADAVRRFAGVSVRDYGGIGGLKTVSVRNLGAAHTAISYDGVVVSNTQAGQIDISRFSIDNIELISLAVGQSDDLLQSARAYASAGVLSIVTEKPQQITQRRTLTAHLKGGAFGYVGTDVKWTERIAEKSFLALNGNYYRADGNYPFTIENGKYTTKAKRINSDVDAWHGEANFVQLFNDQSELDAKAYYAYSKRGLPGVVTLFNLDAAERLCDKDFFVQANYKKRFSPAWQMVVRGKYTYSGNRYEDYGVQYIGGKTTERFRQNEEYLSASVLYRPSLNWAFSLSQDGAINTLWSNLQDCPFPDRYSSLTALRAKYQQLNWQADFTLVNTYMTDRVERGDKPEDKKRLSPSLSVNYKPFGSEAFYVRALWKNTFRVPTFNDLYYSRVGNRLVRPEKATEYNVGLTWNNQHIPFLNYLSLTVDGYYNDVKDKIVAFPSTYVWRMVNYGKVKITGLDVTLAAECPLNECMKLTLNGAYTLQKALNKTDPAKEEYNSQLPYTPRHNGNVSLLFSNPWVNVGYTMVAVGERYSMAQNIDTYLIKGYTEHSLTLSHTFRWKQKSLRLQGELLNFTDEQYEVIKYYPMPGRSWNLSATIHL